MSNNMVSMKVDSTVVKSVLEKQIQAAIVAQLGNQDELIASAVRLALNKKVDHNGNHESRYSSDLKYDFLELLATKSIHESAKEALKEWLAENQHKIKEAVLEELRQPGRQKTIAAAYLNAIESSLSNNWRMDCNIAFKEQPE